MYKALCFAAREMNHDRDGTMRLVWFALASIAVAFLACRGTSRSQPGNPDMHDDDDGDDIDGASNRATCGSGDEGERIVVCLRGKRSMDGALDFGSPRRKRDL